ncbi:SDR family oxidoreductase [Gordonia pseudamarae]|uniref:SDR family NAD(P)-dependent oxidoreductase n=1 Tax=Gordonia pseudamarae TaxID=2831662 RepID=UPI001AFC80A9|nr:SDR family oxidoreductase [Gordonia pseudamarae]QHN27837.1 SDR family oxidoreductase [Gordonia pseudamarae]
MSGENSGQEARPGPVVRELADCGALIVGGTSGIGLSSALALARGGVSGIVLVGRSADRGLLAQQRFVDEGLPKPQFVAGDAVRPESAQEIADRAAELLPGIDILLSSTAPDVRPEPFGRMPLGDIGSVLSQLALAPLQMSGAVIPHMRRRGGGSIITVASDTGKTATPGESVIGAAMAAIIMFTRTLAIEEKRYGIRANVLTPSLVEGTITAEKVTKDGFSAKLFAKAAQAASLGVARPEDLGELVAFLAGPGAAKLTGQAISVNGGISAA